MQRQPSPGARLRHLRSRKRTRRRLREDREATKDTVETQPPATGFEVADYEEPYLAGGVRADAALRQHDENVEKMISEAAANRELGVELGDDGDR